MVRKKFGEHFRVACEVTCLNPIEILCTDVKKEIAAPKPTNESLWKIIQEPWHKIPLKQCQDLVESMPKRYVAVILQAMQVNIKFIE